MGELLLYHGSKNIIQKPQFGTGNIHNDYGLAFYCTENVELAREWACTEDSDGFVNSYSLDIASLTELNLCDGSYHILNWLICQINLKHILLQHLQFFQSKLLVSHIY